MAGDAGVALLVPGLEAAEGMARLAARQGVAPRVVVAPDAASWLRAPGPPPRVVAAWLDRLEDGAGLLDAVAACGAPVVALHAAVPGDAPLRRALFDAAGIITAESHHDLLDIAFFLASLRAPPAGPRVAIMTGGGGGGVIAADLCAAAGLVVPPLAAATRAALAPLVPSIASTANPVDLTPEMFNERSYDRVPAVFDIVAADPGVDALLLPTTFNAPRGDRVAGELLAAFHARCPKPVLIAADPPAEMRPVLRAAGVAPIGDVANAARALARIAPPAARATPHARFVKLAITPLTDPHFGEVVTIAPAGLHGEILPDFAALRRPCGEAEALRGLRRFRFASAELARAAIATRAPIIFDPRIAA